MVQIVTGSLFLSECEAIVNAVNTDGYMGKGIAKSFKENFPKNNNKYLEACRNKELTIGKLFVTEEDGFTIINFPTKRSYKNPSKIEYIEEGLDALIMLIREKKFESIAMPLLGCDNGKLDKNIVLELIHQKLDNVNCNIYLYHPFEYCFPLDKNFAESEYFAIIVMRYNKYSKIEIINRLKEEKKDTRYLDQYIKAIHETIIKNETTLEMIYKDLTKRDKKCLDYANIFERSIND